MDVVFVELTTRDDHPAAVDLTGDEELKGLVGVEMVTVFAPRDVTQNLSSKQWDEGVLVVEAPDKNGSWISVAYERAILRADLPRSLGPTHPPYRAFTFNTAFVKSVNRTDAPV